MSTESGLSTTGVSLRLVLTFFVVLSDAIRGSTLFYTEDVNWALLTFSLPLFSLLVSILYGTVNRKRSRLCQEALGIHVKLLGPFLSSGPQCMLIITSLMHGVQLEEFMSIGELKSSIPFASIISFTLNLLAFTISALYYDKESFKTSFTRSLAYLSSFLASLSFRLVLGALLLTLVPYYTLGLILPLAYLLNLAIYRVTSQSKDWECILYAYSSLFYPSGYARRLGARSKISEITTQSGVKMAKVNLESLVQRLRLFLVLFHCLSFGALVAFVVVFESIGSDDADLISAFRAREAVYAPLALLYFLSLVSSALYHKKVVSARNATQLWDSITPAARPRHSNTDIELQPVGRPLQTDEDQEEKGDSGNNRCDGGDRDECVACELMIEGSSFRSSMTGREYKFMTPVTCTTRNVIYLVTCNKCRKQYVGKTEQQFKQRHYGHRREIETKVSPLGKHFAEECGYINWRFQIIDSCETPSDLTRREGYWQQELQTYVPAGLNSRREKL